MAAAPPKHTAVFAKLLARNLLERGYAEETIFRGTAFDASLLKEKAPIADAADVLNFMEQAEVLTKNNLFGFQLAQGQDIRGLGLVCFVGLAAPNLTGFLVNYARYARVVSDVLKVDASKLAETGTISWNYSVPSNVRRRQHVEYSSTLFLNTLRHYSATHLTPRKVCFVHLRKDNIAPLEAFYGCEINFGEIHNSFEFTASELELPLISADEQLLKVLQGYGDQVLAEKSREVPGLVFEVERIIADLLSSGTATLDTVASELGMSPRSLSRKLAAEGTSFFRVLEDLRKSLSKTYLRDSDLVLAEIAFLLGYSGLSSFNDAFKRWTGHSPGQYRTA